VTDSEPRIEYQRRLENRRQNVARFERQHLHIAFLRLIAALVFIILGLARLFGYEVDAIWLIAPAIFFIILIVIHERVAKAKGRASRAVIFYEDGLARINDAWIGRGQSIEQFRNESHLYAGDLDIFGKASLFELLCTARLRAGEETLAAWLSEPAKPAEILARQQAVEELRNGVDLREELASFGSEIRSAIHPEILTRWARCSRSLPRGKLVPILLFAASIITVGVLFFDFNLWPIAFAVEGAIGMIYRRRVRELLEGVERPETELLLLSQILARLEKEHFKCPKLAELQRALTVHGRPASRQIAGLARLTNALNWRRNQLFAPFSLILFWATQLSLAIENWREENGTSIEQWLKLVGEFEALCALAGYAYEHPDDGFPEIVANGPILDGRDLRHPLMPAASCVPNAVSLTTPLQLLVVSGSNMSGKSTLLRTVGTNAVLALAGAPVRAKSLRISPLAIGATLRIQDSLQAGTSRFYAEIQRIHHIVELTKGKLPVLFLLDEVLHGTNSHDRAVGAEAIVRGLIDRGAIGLVTTHDLALATVADSLSPRATNVHFEDTLVEGRMVFDYRMRPGVVQKSNALALMRAVGLDV
jgi:hypothetical protein